MKKLLIVLMVISLCAVLAETAQSQESKAQVKPLVYTGNITKIEKPDMITVQTKEGPMEFYLKHDGGKDCVPLEKLVIGDNVTVNCKDKKERMEATCVKKMTSGATFKGGSLHGGTIK